VAPLTPPARKKKYPHRVKRPSLEWERKLGFPGIRVAGVDEVGRGCLAGPVVSAAAVLPSSWAEIPLPKLYRRYPILREVRDSKLVPKSRRTAVRDWLVEHLDFYAIGEATSEEIDRINILNATYLSMMRAVESLGWEAGESPRTLLIDGNSASRELRANYAVTTLIEGDRHSIAVASASILAKVHRDAHLVRLSETYPDHAFHLHKGYGTAAHYAAIEKHGLTPEHRRSFAPVREYLERD
jgi:ribonuclease HII